MRALGLRAENGTVYWAVVEGSSNAPVLAANDKLKSPKAYSEADSLLWFSVNVKTLFLAHSPNVVAVRQSETFLQFKPKPNVLASMLSRARIEGALLASASESGLRILSGNLTTIRAALSTKSAKAYLDGDEVRGLDWSHIKNEKVKEAILAAVAALGVE